MGQVAKKHCARPSRQPGLPSLDHNAEELEGRKRGARAQSAEGHAGSRLSPCWPAAEARPGSPPLLGILQPWLQPSGDPLPSNSSRALAPRPPGQHIDRHPAACEGLHTKHGPAMGQPGHQACHPATWSG